ncbi:MFS transporter [Ensifer sp. LC163]|uniref:MFS transporter n=1 Tax=Ensifer sp. LC163 TaxID=1120652 RepID=UPI000813A6EE|nr:MFS transporter [Ensifer sp. LC163]OCP37993.1 MFS transporter [Ensifer sp. LC163]
MNIPLLLLALATFATGTAENIVIGILPDVASGLGVSIGLAGQLTSVFSVTFALTAPAALLLTARLERKTLLLLALVLFIASNVLAAASPNYGVLVAARIGMAAASATACLVATMLATEIVPAESRGRAIGLIFMGISASLVLGVPAGMLLSGTFGWRSVFTGLALFAVCVLFACQWFVPGAGRSKPPRGRSYAGHLRSFSCVCAQLVSVLMIGGHFSLFAYLAPYLAEIVGMHGDEVVTAFFAFGIAGVCGGYLGGRLSDAVAPRLAIRLTPFGYVIALVAIPFVSDTRPLFIAVMMLWGCISWMISPVVQSFLIRQSPETAEAGVGLNLSAMHVGVGLGTGVGGVLVEAASPSVLPAAAALLAGLAVIAAFAATWRASVPNEANRHAAP